MHGECMDEMTVRVKQMRKEAAAKFMRAGIADCADYLHPGEMRGYFKVLELICHNPHED